MALLRGWGQLPGRELVCIKGNAECYTFTPHLEALPWREERGNQTVIELVTWFRAHLAPTGLEWLESLPDMLLREGDCLAHDSPLDRLFPARWRRPGLADEYQEWFYHSPGIKATRFDQISVGRVSKKDKCCTNKKTGAFSRVKWVI